MESEGKNGLSNSKFVLVRGRIEFRENRLDFIILTPLNLQENRNFFKKFTLPVSKYRMK